MKFPNHILLDTNKNALLFVNQYWAPKYLLLFEKNTFTYKTFLNYKFFFFQKKNKFIKFFDEKNKFTLSYKIFKKLTNTVSLANPQTNNISRLNLYKIKTNYTKKKKTNYAIFLNLYKTTSVVNSIQTLFNINFLKKEKIYTKLKYSRVPQYDIVSGGVAAIFAGFLGFLICEKFGFELLDSGDFYFFFMYIVFFFFFFKLFIKILNVENQLWGIFTLKWVFFFVNTILILTLNFFKNKFF